MEITNTTQNSIKLMRWDDFSIKDIQEKKTAQ